ncbi:MAG TPA: acylphosphatase [Hyphomicrobiaceae bacterium]|nr:acylphosphatase [Hyphomicrobiaceae bacterium]
MHVSITGTVQGVGFRYWTEAIATDLALAGWVRNRADGSVEAVFSGPAEAVEEILDRCHEGPRPARVERVDVREGESTSPPGFRVLPTA